LEAYKIELLTGSSHIQTLSGLGSAGYTWDYVIEGPADILNVSQIITEPQINTIPSTYDTDYLYNIEALKPGKTQIRFYLQRPWAKDIPPLREVVLDVSII
jgi:predicted secreted protein